MKVINQEISDRFAAYNGDCVDVLKGIPDNSIDYVIYSPPFAQLYCYSNSDRDLGNVKDYDEFFEQYGFVTRELVRVLRPGRLMSVHCMLLPIIKQISGYIGLRDFRGDLIRHHQNVGQIFHSEVVIWRDPVVQMQRTHALGLLYKQLRKDSIMSRQAIPDYLETFRKPGDNVVPVTKNTADFPVELWQKYASPVWMDIKPGDTLQHETAREDRDGRHICPLQLEVIERAIDLWTNPGDLVLDPFGGIGSTGYVAVKRHRRAVLVELKESYWRLGTKNLRDAEASAKSPDLFSLMGVEVAT